MINGDSHSDPLQSDLAELRALARTPGVDPSLAKQASGAADKLEFHMRVNDWSMRCIKRNGLDTFWADFTDHQIAILMADEVHAKDENTLVRQAAHEAVTEWSIANKKMFPSDRFEAAFSRFVIVLVTSLAAEAATRQQKHETLEGARTKKLVVEERRRGVLLTQRAREVTTGLGIRQSAKGSPLTADARDDAQSIATQRIWEEVQPYCIASPPASSVEFLCAVMSGAFNKISDHARDHVRTVIETELRRSLRLEEGDAPDRDSGAGEFGSSRIDRAKAGNNAKTYEDRILIEQVLAGLDEKDAELLIEYYVLGTQQEDLAAELGISQTQVSKRLKSLRSKIRASLSE